MTLHEAGAPADWDSRPCRPGRDPGEDASVQERSPLDGPRAESVRGRVVTASTSGPWRAAALAIAVTCWVLVAAAVALQCVHGEVPDLLAYWLMDVLTATVYGGVTLLMLPRSRHPAAWILALTGLGCAVSGFTTQYVPLAAEHPGVPVPALLALLPAWVWMPGTYATMAVLPWLVSARRQPRWVRAVVAVAVVAIAVRTAFLAVARYPGVDNPIGLPAGWLYDALWALGYWPDRLCVALSFAGAARLWWLRRRAVGDEGRGYGWLVVGQLFMAVAFVPVVFPVLEPMYPMSFDFAGVSLIAAQAFLPAALLVVVLGQRLWGIDVAVNRGAVWLMLTGGVVGGYVLLAWFAQRFLPEHDRLAGMVAVAVVLAASQPLRLWIERRVDRLVYGPAQDPAVLLRALSDAAASAPGSRRTLDSLVEALTTGLRLGGVEVRSTSGDTVARTGRIREVDVRLPLVVEGRRLGELVVSAAGGQTLDARTRRMVEQMGSVIAVVLELAQVNDRLAATRDRLLEVRHEERRILRRDLHDGMGPTLAGVGLGLVAAQRRLTHDPAGAHALLDELKGEVDRRTDAIRLLAHSLLPPQLDAGDLPQALQVLARRYEAPGVTVRVDCRTGDLDPRRQIAVYHVAAEAMLNAYRHGRARRIEVAVSGGDGSVVRLEVVDDGVGIDAPGVDGVGLQAMRERAEELDGRLEVGPGSDGRGTRVRMMLP